jgi:hypothetical protein
MEFSNVPKDFLENIKIVPHNFNDPENKKHAEYVNLEMKNDLFNEVYSKIKIVERLYLKND